MAAPDSVYAEGSEAARLPFQPSAFPDMESAVQLSWTYGASPVPGSVINLSNAISEKFFFVSSNTAVIQVRVD